MNIIMWERYTYLHEWKNQDKICFGRQRQTEFLPLHKKKRINIIIKYWYLKDFIPLYVRTKKHFEIKNFEMQASKSSVKVKFSL